LEGSVLWLPVVFWKVDMVSFEGPRQKDTEIFGDGREGYENRMCFLAFATTSGDRWETRASSEARSWMECEPQDRVYCTEYVVLNQCELGLVEDSRKDGACRHKLG